MKTLTLSKPMRSDRRRPSQRVTRAKIIVSAVNTEAVQPVKAVDHAETGGTPEKTATVSQIHSSLRRKYPVMKDCKPLAIGTGKQIMKDRDPLWGYHRTSAAIHRLTQSKKYIKAIAADGSRRYHLDGSDAGAVSDEHRQYARGLLESRKQNAPTVSQGASDESYAGILDQDQGGSTDA